MEIEELYSIYLEHPNISTDSRSVKEGDLYFALGGDNFDGNSYAEEALRKGASFAIIDNQKYSDLPNTILVDSSLGALQDLAKHHRLQLDIPVIGLTGSNGKTTSKELINTVLSRKYDCLATDGNFNNHIGVPLTLLNIRSHHQIAIVEMGANHIDEISFLCSLSLPSHGVITNIGRAHLGEFGGFEKIIQAKMELYDFIEKTDALLFVNADDDLLMNRSGVMERVTYGSSKQAQFRGRYLSNKHYISVEYSGDIIETQLVGKYNFDNIMLAIAIGEYFGVDTSDIKTALESYKPSNNRSQIKRTKSNTLILDAYNANPSSVELAIENLLSMKDRNKYFILGDMLELGEESADEHKRVLQLLTKHSLEGILVGKEYQSVFENESGIKSCVDTGEALKLIATYPIEDKLILIKGSRGIKLEVLSEVL